MSYTLSKTTSGPQVAALLQNLKRDQVNSKIFMERKGYSRRYLIYKSKCAHDELLAAGGIIR